MAARPGGNWEPEIMAVMVSRRCSFVFAMTSSGSARSRASLMYVLSFAVTGLTDSAARTILRGNAAAAMTQLARCSKLRLVIERFARRSTGLFFMVEGLAV